MNDPDLLREQARAWIDARFDPGMSLRSWLELLADSGWAAPAWPAAWYGKDLSAALAAVAIAEFGAAGVPGPPAGLGPLLAAPTIIAHGTDELKRKYVRAVLTGEHAWCQLFSEPDAGSDLASLATRAERDGEDFVIDGQKVWTSAAQVADYGLLLARTNTNVPKHRGITCFALRMDQPGVEVRPLRQMTGDAMFSEVFLTGARAGGRPGAEASIGKLMASQIARRGRDTAVEICGPLGMLAGPDGPLGGALAIQALAAPTPAIYGGSDQIQRNVIGERVLGLPKEPDVSRDVPFRDLKKGTQEARSS
jgi:alkylation response protein AidB-like acyl-CoA dehydrogenase